MILYKTIHGPILEEGGSYYSVAGEDWDHLIDREDLQNYLRGKLHEGAFESTTLREEDLLPPIGQQEVWGAGVTYHRSRNARMEEAETGGGGDFYSRVYTAQRPELFFKASSSRVAGQRQEVRIRSDSNWSVPEPELTLYVTSTGKIVGWTIGNDMTSRDIEGENPLYLSQAKIYSKSCALGPGILVTDEALPRKTGIRMDILRDEETVFSGRTKISSIRRSFGSLVEYLFRDNVFHGGCFLMTGTGIIPPGSFTLRSGDEIHITIDPIGTLMNRVA